MAKMSKKKKIFLIILTLLVGAAAVVAGPRVVYMGLGKFNGMTWGEIQKAYPGFKVSWTGNVTISSRPELKGKFAGGKLIWNNGTEWV